MEFQGEADLIEIDENTEAVVDVIDVHALASPNWHDRGKPAQLADYDFEDCDLHTIVASGQKPKFRRLVWEYQAQNKQSFTINAIEDAAADLLSWLERLASRVINGHKIARPLLFVCHSLGGLILKKALLLAVSQSNSSSIVQQIFLGTPHACHAKNWLDKIGGRLQLWPDEHSPEISQTFTDISNAFQRTSYLYEIVYICKQDWGECDGAVQLHENCLWSVVAQESKFRTKENHYILPTPYPESMLNARVQYIIVHIILTVLREQESPKLYLEREQASIQRYTSLRDSGTCNWLFARTDYQAWLNASGPACYWIHGVAGAGKSVLCSAILEDLRKSQSPMYIYFGYFSNGETGRADYARDFLKAVIYQLKEHKQHPVPTFTLYSILSEINTNERPISRTDFRCYLKKVLMGADATTTITMVIDGLDNEEWIQDIIIGEIVQSNTWRADSHPIKCCVSSQFSYNAASHPDQVIKISMSNNPGVYSDIFHFAARKVSTFSQSSIEPRLTSRDLAQQLCDRANGVFLWVALAIENVRHADSLSELQKMVELAPSTVEGIYKRSLDSLPSRVVLIAQKILSWVAAAYRPLKISELLEALSAEDQDFLGGTQTARAKNKPLLQDSGNEILRLCGSLIGITQEGILRFRHPSVRRYLLIGNGLNILKGRIYEPDEVLARTCLSLLNSHNKGTSLLLDMHFPKLMDNEHTSTLIDYAATYWSVHVRLAEPHTQSLNSMLQRSLEIALNRRCEKLPSSRTPHSVGIMQTILRFCAYFGFKSLVQMYLEMGIDPDGKACDYCETPLHLAVASGHSETVALLLERGASVHSRTYAGGETALHYASSCGRSEIAKMLTLHGADVNALTYNTEKTPLHLASAQGHLEIMKLLITHDADMNAVMKTTNETPLHLAAANGQLQAVIYLLDGRTPSLTETELYTSIVQQPYYRAWSEDLLIELGKNGQFVWEAEARHSAERDINDLLIWSRRYADINVCACDGRTALQEAAKNGHEAIVQLLLERGASQKLERNSQFTALRLAAEHGHLSVVELLLRSGAYIDTGTKSWGLLLEQVADNGHQSIADLLMWQAFSLEIVGAASQWQMLCLATRSKQNVVQNTLHKKRGEGERRDSSIKKRLPKPHDRKIASKLPLRWRVV